MKKKNYGFAVYLCLITCSIIFTLVVAANHIIRNYIYSYKTTTYEIICFHSADSGLEYALALLQNNQLPTKHNLFYKVDSNSEVLIEITLENLTKEENNNKIKKRDFNKDIINTYNIISNAILMVNKKKVARKTLLRYNVTVSSSHGKNYFLDTGLFMEANQTL